MVRPATPLSSLIFLAFALLIVSILSTPIIKGIKLGGFRGTDYGVFGFCEGAECSGIKVGYDPAGPADSREDGDFSLPPSARRSLSSLLIVHPVAALFTLVVLVLSLSAHLRSPAHSPRYFLFLIFSVLPAFLLSLLAFLVDIMLFIPHVKWGTWLVLAATILLALGAIFMCAMRRSLVSRKAHHKRIAENTDLNGENFFNQTSLSPSAPLGTQPTVPTVMGAPGPDKLPEFATFDVHRKPDDRSSQEERIPLNPRAPSMILPDKFSPQAQSHVAGSDDGSANFRPPRRAATDSSFSSGSRGLPDYEESQNHPLPPPAIYSAPSGVQRNFSNPRPQDPYASGTLTPSSSTHSSFVGARGRGGFGLNGRSAYGRGGYAGPGRGPAQGPNGENRGTNPWPRGPATTATVGRGGSRGPTPVNVRGYGASTYGNGSATFAGGYQARGPSPGPPSAPGYRQRTTPGPPLYGAYGAREPSPGPGSAMPMQPSPSPPPPMPALADDNGMIVGQAVEMDASTGSPSPSHTGFAHNRAQELEGGNPSLVPSEQNGSTSAGLPGASIRDHPGSYVPARAGWGHQRPPQPIDLSRIPPAMEPDAPLAELPTTRSRGQTPDRSHTHTRVPSSDNYYEDVDSRFVESAPVQSTGQLPSSLQPAYQQSVHSAYPMHENPHITMTKNDSYERLHDMARSPAQSDISHHTSVSQRGINPRWQPPSSQSGMATPRSGQRHPPRDNLLAGNNDFELAARNGPGGPHATPLQGQTGPSGIAISSGGRYPIPNDF